MNRSTRLGRIRSPSSATFAGGGSQPPVLVTSFRSDPKNYPQLVAGAVVGLASAGYLSLAMRVGRTVGQLFEDITSRPLLCTGSC